MLMCFVADSVVLPLLLTEITPEVSEDPPLPEPAASIILLMVVWARAAAFEMAFHSSAESVLPVSFELLATYKSLPDILFIFNIIYYDNVMGNFHVDPVVSLNVIGNFCPNVHVSSSDGSTI